MDFDDDTIEQFLRVLDGSNAAYKVLSSEYVPINFKELYNGMKNEEQKSIYLEMLSRALHLLELIQTIRVSLVLGVKSLEVLYSSKELNFAATFLMEYQFEDHFPEIMHIACNRRKRLSPELRILQAFLVKFCGSVLRHYGISERRGAYGEESYKYNDYCTVSTAMAAQKLDVISVKSTMSKQKSTYDHLVDIAEQVTPKKITLHSDFHVSLESLSEISDECTTLVVDVHRTPSEDLCEIDSEVDTPTSSLSKVAYVVANMAEGSDEVDPLGEAGTIPEDPCEIDSEVDTPTSSLSEISDVVATMVGEGDEYDLLGEADSPTDDAESPPNLVHQAEHGDTIEAIQRHTEVQLNENTVNELPMSTPSGVVSNEFDVESTASGTSAPFAGMSPTPPPVQLPKGFFSVSDDIVDINGYEYGDDKLDITFDNFGADGSYSLTKWN